MNYEAMSALWRRVIQIDATLAGVGSGETRQGAISPPLRVAPSANLIDEEMAGG